MRKRRLGGRWMRRWTSQPFVLNYKCDVGRLPRIKTPVAFSPLPTKLSDRFCFAVGWSIRPLTFGGGMAEAEHRKLVGSLGVKFVYQWGPFIQTSRQTMCREWERMAASGIGLNKMSFGLVFLPRSQTLIALTPGML